MQVLKLFGPNKIYEFNMNSSRHVVRSGCNCVTFGFRTNSASSKQCSGMCWYLARCFESAPFFFEYLILVAPSFFGHSRMLEHQTQTVFFAVTILNGHHWLIHLTCDKCMFVPLFYLTTSQCLFSAASQLTSCIDQIHKCMCDFPPPPPKALIVLCLLSVTHWIIGSITWCSSHIHL